uniref:Uncharacterized protein n=1 Tax=Myoviridae sp. ctGrV43 TaxID=2825075 RepID=A0A8S5UEZ5_9CAUD|nr:MAG TPA: hypothetical protein [Myoviridae sp. ctGrV43]DAH31578.1 MAG TPA: hypothetical protein [Caudoviricetes sp.]DAM92244.1 MAG TPA: hypothetical protein [Caudoviricetes sp.]DAU67541.1 MAG TPA: hypothetical protein [Caudoviricetes sp.]
MPVGGFYTHILPIPGFQKPCIHQFVDFFSFYSFLNTLHYKSAVLKYICDVV